MQPTDSGQWTEQQLTEAFRQAVVSHLERQTKHLDTIRTLMILFAVLFFIGALIYVLIVATSGA